MSDMGERLDQFAEVETGEAFTLQNPRLLKVELSETSVMARNGAMVAYQGDVKFTHKGGAGAAAQEGRPPAALRRPAQQTTRSNPFRIGSAPREARRDNLAWQDGRRRCNR